VARKDYYATLGVPRNASAEDIRKAFRAKALRDHPDRNPGNADAERRFREAAEAWEVLGDPEQRARFDRLGPLYTSTGRPPTPEDLEGILKDAFGNLFGLRRDGAPGEDLRHQLTVTLEEAASGCEREVTVTRTLRCRPCEGSGDARTGRTPCGACGGSGTAGARWLFRNRCGTCDGRGYVPSARCDRCSGEGTHPHEERLHVRVPAGVATGQKLRVRGKGHESATEGLATGDLYVLVAVAEHPFFRRRGADLLSEAPLTLPELLLGTELRVPTLEGSTTIRVPAGTPPGAAFLLAGRGMPNGRSRGDLHVLVRAELPEALTSEQRQAALTLARTLRPEDHSRRRQWDLDVRSRG
jgi:molecular chaperone DnaJ